MERNALSCRLPDQAAFRRQALAVETERNVQRRGIRWRFTSRDARRKLERLYPVKQSGSDEAPWQRGMVKWIENPVARWKRGRDRAPL